MGVGVAFFEDDNYIPFREEAITILGLGTSNEAEYHAVIQALLIILTDYDLPNIHCIHIYTDSQLIYNQIIGEWLCIPKNLKVLLAEVWRLVREVKKPLILFHWISRTDERQKIVDVLSKRANPYFNKKYMNTWDALETVREPFITDPKCKFVDKDGTCTIRDREMKCHCFTHQLCIPCNMPIENKCRICNLRENI